MITFPSELGFYIISSVTDLKLPEWFCTEVLYTKIRVHDKPEGGKLAGTYFVNCCVILALTSQLTVAYHGQLLQMLDHVSYAFGLHSSE